MIRLFATHVRLIRYAKGKEFEYDSISASVFTVSGPILREINTSGENRRESHTGKLDLFIGFVLHRRPAIHSRRIALNHQEFRMEAERKAPSLLDICVRKAIDNLRRVESVDGVTTPQH
jgi:hypothetical protein